jgi:hypothetical protein
MLCACCVSDFTKIPSNKNELFHADSQMDSEQTNGQMIRSYQALCQTLRTRLRNLNFQS